MGLYLDYIGMSTSEKELTKKFAFRITMRG